MAGASVGMVCERLGLWTSVWKIHLNVLFRLGNKPRMTRSFMFLGTWQLKALGFPFQQTFMSQASVNIQTPYTFAKITVGSRILSALKQNFAQARKTS
jgi:hypothetical protein